MLTAAEIALVVFLVIPTAWALYDILRTSPESWTRTHQSQGIWVLVVLLVPIVGPILYLAVAKPRLRAPG